MGIRRSTRRTTRVPSYAFTPKSLPGLVAWYRADLGITIGTGVSAWADQSGTGDSNKNLTQATGSKQPTLNASDGAYNGKPTLSFASASAQFLSSTAFAAPVSSPFTIFLVGNDSGAAVQQVYCDMQNGAPNEAVIQNNGANYSVLNTPTSLVSGVTPTNAPRVYVWVSNGASSSFYISARTAATTGTVGTSSLTGVTIGAAVNGLINLNGKVAEYAAHSRALSQSEVNQVLAYCGARYAIAIGP